VNEQGRRKRGFRSQLTRTGAGVEKVGTNQPIFMRFNMAMGDGWRHSLTMLFCIVIVGGLTLMMGQHTRSESLFYYFRLDDQVPENHLLRLVDKHIDFGFVRDRLSRPL
jgi:hypothetical protein